MKTKTAFATILIITACLASLIFWYVKNTDFSQAMIPQINNPRYMNAAVTLCLKQIYGYDVLERRERGEFVPPADYTIRVNQCMEELILLD